MDGIWPRAYIFSWPPMGDGFVSGRKAPHHLAPATQLPLMPWNVFSYLNSFARNRNICLIKMTGNELCFFVGFYFILGGHFPIFPARGCPNDSARDMALMGSSLAQKHLIAPSCLSGKSRVSDLAFKAFWSLALIQFSGAPFLSVYTKGRLLAELGLSNSS